MMRLHWSSPEVRAAADLALLVVDNILKNSNDSKFWSVNVRSEVSWMPKILLPSCSHFTDEIVFLYEIHFRNLPRRYGATIAGRC